MSVGTRDRCWERWYRRFRWRRPRRILLLLTAVWVVQGFDLGFTLFAHECGTLLELNPAADWALQRGPGTTILFKVSLVLFGSIILWRYRSRAISEGLLWVVALACVGLSLRWQTYFAYFVEHSTTVELVQPNDAWAAHPAPWFSSVREPQSPTPARDNAYDPGIQAAAGWSERKEQAASAGLPERHMD